MDNFDIKHLASSISELITLCDQLNNENSHLRDQLNGLTTERNTLLNNQQSSKKRMETIITRLKSMEFEL